LIQRELAKVLSFDFNDHTKDKKERYQKYLLQKTAQFATDNENLITDLPLQNIIGYTDNKQIQVLAKQAMINLYDILFYLPPEIDIEDDGVRNTNHNSQTKIDEIIRKMVIYSNRDNKDLLVKTITWDVKNRVKKSIDYINTFKQWNIWTWF